MSDAILNVFLWDLSYITITFAEGWTGMAYLSGYFEMVAALQNRRPDCRLENMIAREVPCQTMYI